MTLSSVTKHATAVSQIMRQNAFISLFAMALIYVAPLISQLNHASMNHGAMNHESHQNTALSLAAPPLSTSDTAANHFGLEAACGYCTLLFHLNWLNVFSFSLPIIPQQAYLAIAATILEIELPPTYAAIQPRAPPRLSLHTDIT
ncbi:DUF2946 domain-containing protein [Marinomonas arenicola]|uniref:DUF2946 domain-containing protein n=1 Tax=Marinomonas arenicola TaxID=569601 RepID=UPI00311D7AE3